MELQVTICSHHFRVNKISPRARPVVDTFVKRFIEWGFKREKRRVFRAPIKVFAAATRDRNEYRFHINTLKDFKQLLQESHILDSTVEWVTEEFYPTQQVELPIKPEWEVRDYQEEPIEYINVEDGNRSKFVGLQTGKGKSFISMVAASRVNAFVLMILRPMYIDKWIIDLRKTYDLKFNDIMIVQGSEHLKAFLTLAKTGQLNCKVVLISNKTMQNYIKLYEELREGILKLGYECLPHDMFKLAKSVRRTIDEVHLDFHLNFKLDLYTHVESAVAMSATMIADQEFTNKMYEIAYPSYLRYKDVEYKRYIKSRAVLYNAKEPNKIRTSDYGSRTYSHHVFEASLVRHPTMMNNFFALIWRLLEDSYIKNYRPGNRAIIFCSSIDMCTRVAKHFQKVYSNLAVNRYVEDDPYENLMESDIVVSTIQSAGTAVDIPGLQTCIMTVALKSSQSNIQGFGRLREMKSGQQPEFIYMVCADIPKHIEYHEKKMKLLEVRAASYSVERAGTCI